MAAFTSSSSSSTRFGNIWDANLPNQQEWNADEYQIGVKQNDDDWTIEIALPIKLFDCSTHLESNRLLYRPTLRQALRALSHRRLFLNIFLEDTIQYLLYKRIYNLY